MKRRSGTEFRKRMNICAANAERVKVQKIDQKFKQKRSNRFRTSKSTNHGSTLRLNGSITSDPPTILNAREDHFKGISACPAQDHSLLLLAVEQQMVHLVQSSRENEDFVMDTLFTSEEIDRVLHNLKPGKSAGHDQVQPEHQVWWCCSQPLDQAGCQCYN